MHKLIIKISRDYLDLVPSTLTSSYRSVYDGDITANTMITNRTDIP